MVILACVGIGCERSDPDRSASGAAPAGSAGVASGAIDRRAILGEFLADHWTLPIPAQGPAPSEWSALESSLSARDCGACHPEQHARWSTSLHARAYSPGFSGQLIEGALADPEQIRHCQTCHAPLSEQQPFDAAGAPNPQHRPELRHQGIVCASCHVRAHRRYGPPRRADAILPEGPAPHGGFEARIEFTESRFCAECHQFFDDPGIEGKPIQNTYTEWLHSPAATEGRPCQSCHMPDRAHEWRGIHDREMVRSGVDVALQVHGVDASSLRARLVVRNRDVGHAFPTYVTPRVFVELWQEDAKGRAIEGTSEEGVIGREIDFASTPWAERFDTRVLPGQSFVLEYEQPRRSAAVAIAGRVRVDPSFHYRGVFQDLLRSLSDPTARTQIERARQLTRDTIYVLTHVRHDLDPRPEENDP